MAQIDDDIAMVTNIRGVLESALAWIQADAARQQAAIDAALQNGATGAQLAPLSDNLAQTLAKANEVAAAIAAPGATVATKPVQGTIS